MDKGTVYNNLQQCHSDMIQLNKQLAEELPRDEAGGIQYSSRAFREWQYTGHAAEQLGLVLAQLAMVQRWK